MTDSELKPEPKSDEDKVGSLALPFLACAFSVFLTVVAVIISQR